MRHHARSRLRSRITDFAVYIAIGVALCAVLIVMATYTSFRSEDLRWPAFAGFTAITFGYPLSAIPRRLRTTRLWTAWACLLIVHSALYGIILWRNSDWRVANFVVINALETVGISLALDKVLLLDEQRQPKNRIRPARPPI